MPAPIEGLATADPGTLPLSAASSLFQRLRATTPHLARRAPGERDATRWREHRIGTRRYRVAQPTGELRSRVMVQRYGASGWTTCRDTGYVYSSSVAFGWVAGVDMGTASDCGSGSYRAIGYGAFYQGGSWRAGSYVTPSAWLP